MNAIDRFKEYFGMSPVAAYDDEYLDDFDRPVHHDRSFHDSDLRGHDLRSSDLRHPDRHDRGYSEHGYDDLESTGRSTDRGAHEGIRSVRDRRDDYGYRAADRRLDEDLAEPSPLHSHRSRRDGVTAGAPRDLARPAAAGYDDPAPRPRRYTAPDATPRPAPARGLTRGSTAVAPDEDFDDGLVTTPETVVERPRGFEDGKGVGEHFRDGRIVVLDLSSMAHEDARRMVDFAAGLVFGLDGGMRKVPDRERTFLLQPVGTDLTESEVREAVGAAFRG